MKLNLRHAQAIYRKTLQDTATLSRFGSILVSANMSGYLAKKSVKLWIESVGT